MNNKIEVQCKCHQSVMEHYYEIKKEVNVLAEMIAEYENMPVEALMEHLADQEAKYGEEREEVDND